MQYLEIGFLTFGHEAEVYHPNYQDHNDYVLVNELSQRVELSGCRVVRDGTSGIRAEVVFPPMADCDFTWHKYKEVFAVMREMGCAVSLNDRIRSQRDVRYGAKNRAGGHVHIGLHKIVGMTKEEFSRWSWNNFFASDLDNPHAYDDQMPFELIKDVVYRYANNERFIDTMLPVFRRNGGNSMIRAIHSYATDIRNSQSVLDMASHFTRDHLKYHNVNLQPIIDNRGTIEFRQHHATLNMTKIRNWIRFLLNMFHYSDSERLCYGTERTIVQHSTPSTNPYRARTFKHTLWNCINTQGGMPARDIMRICGVEDINLRGRISEIRREFSSDDIIRTISQQDYGHQYGSSNGRYDLGGYELNPIYTTRNSEARNEITIDYNVDDSVLAGLSSGWVEYWGHMILDRR